MDWQQNPTDGSDGYKAANLYSLMMQLIFHPIQQSLEPGKRLGLLGVSHGAAAGNPNGAAGWEPHTDRREGAGKHTGAWKAQAAISRLVKQQRLTQAEINSSQAASSSREGQYEASTAQRPRQQQH